MQEQIIFKGEATRTTVKYFTTFTGQTSEDNPVYYVIADNFNVPIKLVQSKNDKDYTLNYENYNVEVSAFTGSVIIYTGTVVENQIDQLIDQDTRNFMSDNYINSILNDAKFQNPNNQAYLNSIYSYVFFEESTFNDYNLNIKINRSLDVLNTLNVYNVPVNETVTFNNNTGVLYGKIEAIQVLLDDQGNKLRIPIKNACIGIFNPSDEIPSVGSVDQDGNRIRLNLFENIPTIEDVNNIKSYGSFQSYLTDVNFSVKDQQNLSIPPKYKYTTLTNENGEFVLHNLPTGQQTLMVEIDLLKQGLEPEEVALNFFPYPINDDPNVSTIPHLYFNQFPVNIVPSWGDFQTGYTEANLAISLDLRKWITYFTYPVSARVGDQQNISNQIQNNSPLTLAELSLKGVNNPFRVLVRDMTKPFLVNDPPKVELVKIIDIDDRNLDLKCAWNQEFKIKANKIDFFTSDYNAFKLPANLYDPNGFDTNGNRGVWLGAYQIKITYPDQSISYQVTGFEQNWRENGFDAEGKPIIETSYANHYDLNRYFNYLDDNFNPPIGSGIGKFPYEKPWSLKYPENYLITKKPSIINPLKTYNSNIPKLSVDIVNRNGQVNNITMTEGEFRLCPRYLDGDLVGGEDAWATNANGYGLQNFYGTFFGNDFSRKVTKNEIWRYGATDYWGEEWSNGFNPYFVQQDFNKYPDAINGKPEIIGEKWQRLEAGYAYWLKPRGFPRIKNEEWGDHLLENDYLLQADHSSDSVYNGYFSYFPSIYRYLEEITLEMGARAQWFSRFGRLDIYRIEKPYYLNPPKLPFTNKYANFNFQRIILDQSKDDSDENKKCKARICMDTGLGDKVNCFIWLERGGYNPDPSKDFRQDCNVQFTDPIQAYTISIINIGTTKVSLNGKEVKPSGQWSDRIDVQISNFAEILLPANDKFDARTNSYEGASYLFYLGATSTPRGFYTLAGLCQPVYKYAVGVEDFPVEYYLTSMIPRQVGLGRSKCDAVKDMNTAAGISIKELAEAALAVVVAYTLVGINVLGIPIGYAIPFLFPSLKDALFKEIRDVLVSNPEQYNSDYRQANNIGVFINGMGYYVPAGNGCFNYQRAYFNSRGYLPYVGPEVKDAANLNLDTGVPFMGQNWSSDYKNRLSQGYPMNIFQPKKMFENNLKGTGNMPYYMEYINRNDNVFLDYAKAF